MGPIDVTVRIPVGFDTAALAAGFVERAVANRMVEFGYEGSVATIFKDDGTLNNGVGKFHLFVDGQGFSDEGSFELPHGLVRPNPPDAATPPQGEHEGGQDSDIPG